MPHGGSVRIARIRGIDLKLHISLIVLLAYVVFVASAQFAWVAKEARIDPALLPWGPVVWGFIFAIGLFVSIALHEFGHAFVAQASGIGIKGITLMMLGGVSEMEEIPEKPYTEFRLAVVGPLVSLALAVLLAVIRGATSNPGLGLFCFWLGQTNFVLAIFNLLPAFPLDGGRALRSLLAARRGYFQGTRTAVRISTGFSWGLGILGLFTFNILLILIAFFIHAAAQSEFFLLMSKNALQGIRAGDLALRTEVADESESLTDAAARMLRSRSMVLPVRTEDGSPAVVGLEALRAVDRAGWPETRLKEVMERVPITLAIEEPIGQAVVQLAKTRAHALPVTDKGNLVGVLRYADLSDMLQLASISESKAGEEDQARHAG